MSNAKDSKNKSDMNQLDWKFYDEILETEDIRPFIDCMTCGKCVGDCIAARNSTFNFRKIIQKVLEGKRATLISDYEIWKCFLCGLCTIKCPKNIEIKKLILILRKLAIQSGKGYNLLKYLSDLPDSFLKNGLIISKMNQSLREKIGLPKDYKLSDKALKELAIILEATEHKKALQNFLNHFK